MHLVSIIICTFNPDERLLSRCLQAVLRFAKFGIPYECILVDNNSDVHVAGLNYVQSFIEQSRNARVVREQRQGLSYARSRGLSESAGSYLVYFDDDNEPTPTYIQQAVEAFAAHPDVGVWGPGTIDVEFLESPAPWVSQFCRHHFQERRTTEVEYACLRQPWHRSYPPGTGQCVRRKVMEAYRDRLIGGSCTASDRQGESLNSCGDGQIVHTAITMGLAAGLWPGMRLRHLIPEKRCNEQYLERLAYGVSASLLPATVELFPEVRNLPSSVPPSWWRYAVGSACGSISDLRRYPGPVRRIQAAARVGNAVGRYGAFGKPLPRWLQRRRHRYLRTSKQ